jgi:GH43 family beta-xylosidase
MAINKTHHSKYCFPWIMNRADPYVYRHFDGYYYFTASVPEYDRIILRKSKDLKSLAQAEEHVIWKKHEHGLMSEHIWAPEIHYLDGKWYIYFAAGEREDIWNIRIFVLECENDPIGGPWIEKGKMQSADSDPFSFRSFSLDGTVLENNGIRYFIWAEKLGVGRQISNLYIAEMQSPIKLKTDQVLLTSPDYDWERVDYWVNEGPAVLKKNGNLYLTYSASSTGADYCMGMLIASENSDLLDPSSWKKSRYPVLKSIPEKKIFGPGHNCFTKTKDGKDLLICHARQYKKIIGNPLYDPNRHAMVIEIEWTDDGYPIFGNLN